MGPVTIQQQAISMWKRKENRNKTKQVQAQRWQFTLLERDWAFEVDIADTARRAKVKP
jgi:hypothetical protein